MKVRKQFKINAKMMLKFVSSTSVVGVKILLTVGDSARRQGNCIKSCIYLYLGIYISDVHYRQQRARFLHKRRSCCEQILTSFWR